MWVYAVKTDQRGDVIRFKARTVAIENYQRPLIHVYETILYVARVSWFRLSIALAAKLGLDIYGGGINTAYLNASLSINKYLRSIKEYPCQANGIVSIV